MHVSISRKIARKHPVNFCNDRLDSNGTREISGRSKEVETVGQHDTVGKDTHRCCYDCNGSLPSVILDLRN